MRVLLPFLLLLLSLHSFCQYDAIKPKGIYSSSFVIDEKPRNITYYMPATYGKQETYPLLIVLHAEKSDAATVIKKYGDIMQAKADSAGCVILFPDAYKGHWNADEKDSVNDVGFINIMAEFFLRQFDCDLSEIRLLGIGSGGNLGYRFACESIHKPETVVTINTALNKNGVSNCHNAETIPGKNITSATITNADIQQALTYLFIYRNTK